MGCKTRVKVAYRFSQWIEIGESHPLLYVKIYNTTESMIL